VTLTASYGHLWANIWNCRIPVIAPVHGHCIAGIPHDLLGVAGAARDRDASFDA
jgi:enoyl-CoA hydratase/carnithine racemase